jgi:hypothetical protein
MKTRQIATILLAIIVFVSCGKSNDSKNTSAAIDVSAQWQIDALGNLILGLPDGQWQAKTFTNTELSLFASLDTANLSGTTAPTTVLENPTTYNSIFPNPFNSVFDIHFGFNPGFSGQFVFKSVIVDSLMNPLDKKVVRMQASIFGPGNVSTSNIIAIAPNLPIGRFRIYYTLSSQGSQHFYESWGNIQRN